MVVKERGASYGEGQQLATQMVRRNCLRIWLVYDLRFSVVPTLVGELKELSGTAGTKHWDAGKSPGRSCKAVGQEKIHAEPRIPIFCGNKHRKHLKRAVPTPLSLSQGVSCTLCCSIGSGERVQNYKITDL